MALFVVVYDEDEDENGGRKEKKNKTLEMTLRKTDKHPYMLIRGWKIREDARVPSLFQVGQKRIDHDATDNHHGTCFFEKIIISVIIMYEIPMLLFK